MLVAPSLSPSYLFVLKFHQLHLATGIIVRWNKLDNTNVLQDNTSENNQKNKTIFVHKKQCFYSPLLAHGELVTFHIPVHFYSS